MLWPHVVYILFVLFCSFTVVLTFLVLFCVVLSVIVVGALGAQYFTDRYGRRATFTCAAVLFIIGVLIMSFSWAYGILLVGRMFVGIGVGVGLAVSQSMHRWMDGLL
jgi:predicted MFS family arabinose efflux permease